MRAFRRSSPPFAHKARAFLHGCVNYSRPPLLQRHEVVGSYRDFNIHCDYLHYNPVKHRYVARVADWLHSSFHRFVENGVYPPDWASDPETIEATGFGE